MDFGRKEEKDKTLTKSDGRSTLMPFEQFNLSIIAGMVVAIIVPKQGT